MLAIGSLSRASDPGPPAIGCRHAHAGDGPDASDLGLPEITSVSAQVGHDRLAVAVQHSVRISPAFTIMVHLAWGEKTGREYRKDPRWQALCPAASFAACSVPARRCCCRV